MNNTETTQAIDFLTQEAKNLIRIKLQRVIDGDYLLYNTISKQYLPVDTDKLEGMVDMFITMLAGHGITHLQFEQLSYEAEA